MEIQYIFLKVRRRSIPYTKMPFLFFEAESLKVSLCVPTMHFLLQGGKKYRQEQWQADLINSAQQSWVLGSHHLPLTSR